MNANITKLTQSFSIRAPTAATVLLAGDFTHWQQAALPLQKKSDGIWRGNVELAPGIYHYRFIVDGEWQDDPECTLRVDNPFGTQDAVRVVGSPEKLTAQ